MAIKKGHYFVVGGLLAAGFITSAFLYLQYQKLMDYCIGFKSLKANGPQGLDRLDFNITMNFKNNSNLKFSIVSVDSKVYVNDILVTEITQKKEQVINPESMNDISVNVALNPKQIGEKFKSSITTMLLNAGKTKFRIEMKIKVGLAFFKVGIPFSYNTTLKEILSPSPPTSPSSTSMKCK